MKPRTVLNFFKTRSGKFTVFVALMAGGLLLLGALRPGNPSTTPASVEPADLDLSTNKSQVVESVSKPMEVFRPPSPKPEAPPPSPTNPQVAIQPVTEPAKVELPPPLSLFAETPAQEPKKLSSTYAPFGRLVPCQTVITVDSASIQTPIIGLVTDNIYHAGRLVIPAGTEVHGTAQADRSRERIASGASWTLVWQTGEELHLDAIALDREFDGNNAGWGITDGSAGLRGRVIKSDDMAEIKLFAATFLSGAASALTEKEQTVFGTLDRPSLNNAPFKGAQQVLSTYAQRIYEAIQRDGFYVRVPSGKQFYLYVLQTIDRADAQIGGGEAAPLTTETTQQNAKASPNNPDLP